MFSKRRISELSWTRAETIDREMPLYHLVIVAEQPDISSQ